MKTFHMFYIPTVGGYASSTSIREMLVRNSTKKMANKRNIRYEEKKFHHTLKMPNF